MKPMNPLAYYYYYCKNCQVTVSDKSKENKIKKSIEIDESSDDIPLGIVVKKLQQENKTTLVNINEKSLEKIQKDIWNRSWEKKVLKHKKQRRRQVQFAMENIEIIENIENTNEEN